MSIARKLSSIQAGSTAVAAEGVSFDGTNDYLSRSSDLTGNADGKTFTFSCWVYWDGSSTQYSISTKNSGGASTLSLALISSTNELQIQTRDAAGNVNLQARHPIVKNTFLSVIGSFDLANPSNRHIYVNDATQTITWTTYTNSSIDFTVDNWGVGTINGATGGSQLKGRLAHVYLDYTYRDLSVEANRRLFIDADLKPAANQASLSPILYLPMTDADTAGVNAGTGGDFTINGTLDTAQRGPNQDNCVASDFDGQNDHLYKLSDIAPSNPTKLTFSILFKLDSVTGNDNLFIISDGTDLQSRVNVYTSAGNINVFIQPPDRSSFITLQQGTGYTIGRFHHLSMSVDVVNEKYTAVYNGEDLSNNIFAQSMTSIGLNQSGGTRFSIAAWNRGGGQPIEGYVNGKIGEFYMDDEYYDLSSDNIFVDSNTGLPRSVRQVIEYTGNTPLIAMPIEASNAGLNLGTGGDFTVNSGPFVGARGASEFWARSAYGSTTGGFSNSGLSIPSGKTFSAVFASQYIGGNTAALYFAIGDPVTQLALRLQNSATAMQIIAKNSSGSDIINFGPSSGFSSWNVCHVCVDISGVNPSRYYINGVSNTITPSINDDIYFGGITDTYLISNGTASFSFSNGYIHMCYFTTDYIDFSVEANRNLFVDQLGYPKDLTPAIEAGDIPNPLIYMKFDDPDALGTNSGTGGDFTVNGTVTQGADVDPN